VLLGRAFEVDRSLKRVEDKAGVGCLGNVPFNNTDGILRVARVG